MAKLLSQTLTLRRTQLSLNQLRRFRSTLSGNGRLTEIELSPSSSEGGESEALMLKKLDDIVHRFIVQRATPDWLPFLPGYSFWVPPRRGSMKFADFVGKIADHLSDEESLSLCSDRGWPSSRFFVDEFVPVFDGGLGAIGVDDFGAVAKILENSIFFDEGR
ncbi:uncharacterized protein LOC21399889 [Morus notabilis]|uniref:uncharacterized protein LOC21399889 n=1 Tax=Morus notabilis TaxID=981085 RepID=UPI000CECF6CC|nr:uncharacterized protein LOC21399889 [Morus notabilis]